MVNKNKDDHLDVFNAIVSRLSELDEETQKHILAQVSGWFGFAAMSNVASSSSMSKSSSLNPSFSDATGNMDLTPKEFLFDKAPETNVERVACLAYYLTHYRDVPHFKTFDISKLNTEAAQPKFTNPTVAVNDTSRAKLIVPSSKGSKQLSSMGEQFVLALPNRDEAKAILKKMKPKRRQKSKKKKVALVKKK